MKKISLTKVSGIWLAIVILFRCSAANAQNATIILETEKDALVLQVDNQKQLHNAYLDEKLGRQGEYHNLPNAERIAGDYTGVYNSAYTPSGSRNLLEPAITVTHADGSQSLDLEYVNHTVNKISPDIELLTIHLKDPVYDFEVSLFYKAYYTENVIEQWSSIEHHENGEVVLQKFASANLYLKAGSY
jgi:alpha-galactosidase